MPTPGVVPPITCGVPRVEYAAEITDWLPPELLGADSLLLLEELDSLELED